MIALATATSGVSAAIMPGGRTVHSRFKIPIDVSEGSKGSMSKQSGTAELLRKARLIIWDEAPMAKRWAIEYVHSLLQDVMGNNQDFGGKVVVLGGDFRQVLPVVPKATIQQTISASLVKSRLWPKMKKVSLSRNMRSMNDPAFSEFLLKVGNGEEPTDTEGNIEVPDEMIVHYDSEDDSLQRLINIIFPNLEQNAKRLWRSWAQPSCRRRSTSLLMACSLMRRASGEDDGSSSTPYRIDMASEGVLASEAPKRESVVAGACDADIL
ncbi:Unknown protein [Striga hermonthica]|uniref:ATP-dependent DNA helicase n=1 Tax=Striga hermonthica TaxID=68872 RepID=A0A9N7N3H4_STRHE|nr:Unknown protein [Striga hermonthica]